MERINLSSGVKWEDIVGYSRAVRIGNVIEVSGTIAIDEDDNIIAVGDAYEQTKFILTKIKKALEAAGSCLSDVIRTRIYITDILKWEDIGRAHGDYFEKIKPASTMVEVKSLIHRDALVEIEATAIITED